MALKIKKISRDHYSIQMYEGDTLQMIGEVKNRSLITRILSRHNTDEIYKKFKKNLEEFEIKNGKVTDFSIILLEERIRPL